MISEPGVYDLSSGEYHDDCCPEPSLSASIAHELLTSSPLHAWTAHPKLNPNFRREEKEIFDLGVAAHRYVLEGLSGFAVIEAEDYRTKAAKEARDAARAAGKLPILAHKSRDVFAMAKAINQQLDSFAEKPRPFSSGKPEQTLVWREGSIWCRARLDWLHDDRRFIDDLKTTSASANPEQWTRGPLFSGPDLQAAFYLRGVKVLFGVDATFRFVVVENFAPFAASVIALAPEALVIAEKKRRLAVEIWTRCIETGKWPGYPNRTCYAELPPWIEAQWLKREEEELERTKSRPDRLNSLLGAIAMDAIAAAKAAAQ